MLIFGPFWEPDSGQNRALLRSQIWLQIGSQIQAWPGLDLGAWADPQIRVTAGSRVQEEPLERLLGFELSRI